MTNREKSYEKGCIRMSKELPVLKVTMLGRFSVSWGEKDIAFKRTTSTKALQLFQILLYTKETGIQRTRLLDYLYSRDELADMANNLRVTSHRLKKMLVDAGLPEYDYIQIKKGVYKWNSPMEVEVDALELKKLIEKSEETEDIQTRMELLTKACRIYKGEFLPELSGEDWALLESVEYKKVYEKALKEVCEYKKAQKEYQSVLELSKSASEIYPFDEWQSVMMEALVAMNRYKEAIQIYEDTAKFFFAELGISPSEKMMEQFKEMSERVSYKPQVLNDIRGGLKEKYEEKGAYYCSLPSFRDTYRLVTRIIERNGQSVYLMLVTLTDGKGRPLENKERLKVLSEELNHTIKCSLRKGDSYTRYSPNQFLILLVGTKQENCPQIYDRITKYFSREHKTWAQYLEYYVSSIVDVEQKKSKITFNGQNDL